MARPEKVRLSSLWIEFSVCSHQSPMDVKFSCCATSKFAKCSQVLICLYTSCTKGQARQRVEPSLKRTIAKCAILLVRPSSEDEVICGEDFVLDEDPSEDFTFILRVRPPNDVSAILPTGAKELCPVGRFGAMLAIDGPFPCDFVFDLRLKLYCWHTDPEGDKFFNLRCCSDLSSRGSDPRVHLNRC